MFITLCSENLALDMSHMIYLKKNKIQFIYRNSSFFMEKSVFEKISENQIVYKVPAEIQAIFPTGVPQEMKKLYESREKKYLNNFLNYDSETYYHSMTQRIRKESFGLASLFEGYTHGSLKIMPEFILPGSGFSTDGTLECIYFCGSKTSSPFGLLSAIAMGYKFYCSYFSIFFSYEIFEKYIVSAFVFHYSYDGYTDKQAEIKKFTEYVCKSNGLKISAKHPQLLEKEFEKAYCSDFFISDYISDFKYLGKVRYSQNDGEGV